MTDLEKQISSFINLYIRDCLDQGLLDLFASDDIFKIPNECSTLGFKIASYAWSLQATPFMLCLQQSLAILQTKELENNYTEFFQKVVFHAEFLTRILSPSHNFLNKESRLQGSLFHKKINMLCRIEAYTILLESEEREGILDGLNDSEKKLCMKQMDYVQNLILFTKRREELSKYLFLLSKEKKTVSPFLRPYWPFIKKTTPLIKESYFVGSHFYVHVNLQRYDLDDSLMIFLKSKSVIWIFNRCHDLQHALLSDNWRHLSEDHYIIVLDYPCKKQLHLQQFNAQKWKRSSVWISMFDLSAESMLRFHLEKVIFEECIEASRFLYDYGRRYCYETMKKNWGNSSCLRIQFKMFWDNRFRCPEFPIENSPDLHKEIVKDQESYLNTISMLSSDCISDKKQQKIHVAHCLGYLLDKPNHAPSNRVMELLLSYDRNLYQPYLWITEQEFIGFGEMPLEYSQHSVQMAASRLVKLLVDSGIKVFYGNWGATYEKQGMAIAQQMKREHIDCMIVHEPFPVHLILSKISGIGCCLFMEHGAFIYQKGFHGIILSHQGQKERLENIYRELETDIYVNPKVLSVKSSWESKPCEKSTFKVPSHGFLMMTVSNHLAKRISSRMCVVIENIMKKFSHVYYVLIGFIETEKKEFLERFSCDDVKKRLVFMGPCLNARQLVRSADLYLNEFPIGGSCSVMEAMIAGVPVVAMRGGESFPASYEGEDYLGSSLCCESGDDEGYENLIMDLIQDPLLLQERRRLIIQEIEKRGSPKEYQERHQAIIQEALYAQSCFK